MARAPPSAHRGVWVIDLIGIPTLPTYLPTSIHSHSQFTRHPHSLSRGISFIRHLFMSIIKAEPVDPRRFDEIAAGRPKLEILLDDEIVVKTDPVSVHSCPFVNDVASVKEERILIDDPVCFLLYQGRPKGG